MKIFNTIKNLNLNKESIIFEIGSHYGYETEAIVNLCPNVTVYAFEGDPRNANIFKKNPVYEKVKFYDCCVSNKDGEIDLYLSSGIPPVIMMGHGDEEMKNFCQTMEWTASSSIRKPTERLKREHSWLTFNMEEPQKVKSVTLDSFCNENDINKIDFLWMDVQGAEEDVFNGAKEILKSTRYIYTEFSNKELYEGQKGLRDISEILSGFKLIQVYNEKGGNDALFKNVQNTTRIGGREAQEGDGLLKL